MGKLTKEKVLENFLNEVNNIYCDDDGTQILLFNQIFEKKMKENKKIFKSKEEKEQEILSEINNMYIRDYYNINEKGFNRTKVLEDFYIEYFWYKKNSYVYEKYKEIYDLKNRKERDETFKYFVKIGTAEYYNEIMDDPRLGKTKDFIYFCDNA